MSHRPGEGTELRVIGEEATVEALVGLPAGLQPMVGLEEILEKDLRAEREF